MTTGTRRQKTPPLPRPPWIRVNVPNDGSLEKVGQLMDQGALHVTKFGDIWNNCNIFLSFSDRRLCVSLYNLKINIVIGFMLDQEKIKILN